MINKIWIVGFAKCGSTSLRTYLRQKYTRCEVTSFPLGASLYSDYWESKVLPKALSPDILIVIIKRDPYERIWTAFWWGKKFGNKNTFPEFLRQRKTSDVEITAGLNDPIIACDYDRFIRKAEPCNPIVVKFEDMIKLKTFPHEAKTDDTLKKLGGGDITKPLLDNENRSLIHEEFIKEGINDKY